MNEETANENLTHLELGLIEGLGVLEVALGPRMDTIS